MRKLTGHPLLTQWMYENELKDADLAEMLVKRRDEMGGARPPSGLPRIDPSTISRIRRGVLTPSAEMMRLLYAVSDGKITANDFIHAGHSAAAE